MVDGIEALFKIVSDRSRKLSFKLFFFLAILLVAIAVDTTFHFSHNYHYNTRLDQIDQIQRLKRQSNSPVALSLISEIENEIIHSKHYSYYLRSTYISLTSNTEAENTDETDVSRSFWLMLLSSSSLFFIGTFVRIATGKGGHGTAMDAGTLQMTGLILAVLVWIIPIIYKPLFNYILNSTIQIGILLYLVRPFFKRQ